MKFRRENGRNAHLQQIPGVIWAVAAARAEPEASSEQTVTIQPNARRALLLKNEATDQEAQNNFQKQAQQHQIRAAPA